MKIRLQVREPKSAEEERLWLLDRVNNHVRPGWIIVKTLLLASAFIAFVVLLAAVYPRLH